MSDSSDLSDRIRDWDRRMTQLAEQAEARIDDANRLVGDLHRAGRLRTGVVLGPVMGVHPYPEGQGPEDSGQVIQSVLLIPQGIGVLFWDTEDLAVFPPGPERDEEARRIFTPVTACPPLLRVQLLPFAAELVTRVLRRAGGRR